jgi:CheY-like chemotaxis protein
MSLSILVVDDEPDVADLFRRRFRRESRQGTYVMHFATSGVEALDRLAEEIQPTLVAVLSDINMPGMDGLELLGEIKQRHPNLPEGGAAAEGATNEAQVDLLYRQIGQLKVENDFLARKLGN